ncbi:MAG: GntR family transcriptional regulator [Clostridiales Family XIII bacterium]|jgi:GntR family transcriptional regulator of arabinose operon|nr:GntR family transcriptional regulator [Clostridiales Family XIII bacterium]
MKDIKYLTIVDWIKNEIKTQGMKSGQKLYSESELCKIHGVSRQTVRHALSQLESQNIIWRKHGSGAYVRSVGATKERIMTVGVISTYFSDYIFPSIVTGIESVLTKYNVSMQLAITHNLVSEEERALQGMLAQNVDGLIVEPSKSALPNPNTALYDEVRLRTIPLVFFNAKYPWSDFPCISIDDVAAGYLATKHLVHLGHEKIAGIFMSDNIQGHKRYEGFIKCLNDCGFLMAEYQALWFSTNDRDTLFTLSKDRIIALLQNNTAVVCYNDQIAVSMMEFCRNNGFQVPDDISLVGIDDSQLARVCEVPLTSVRHPQQLLGEQVAEMLLQTMINHDTQPEGKLFVPKLVERKSAKPPHAGTI